MEAVTFSPLFRRPPSEIGKKSLAYLGPKIWQDAPNEFKLFFSYFNWHMKQSDCINGETDMNLLTAIAWSTVYIMIGCVFALPWFVCL